MKSKSTNEEIFEEICEVCGKKLKKDKFGQGECVNCGWYNCYLNEERPDDVAIPNLISLNKAKILYSEGKPLEPDFDDFIKALNAYGEAQFAYNGVYYAVELVGFENKDIKIQLYNSQTKESVVFNDDNDFKNHAKIKNKFLKDIWEQTTDRFWLQ